MYFDRLAPQISLFFSLLPRKMTSASSEQPTAAPALTEQDYEDSGAEQDLLVRLQQRLKGDRGYAPSMEHVAIAVACARDDSLKVGTLCNQRDPPIKRGKAQDTIRAYLKRVREENLLVQCAQPVDPATMEAERRAKEERRAKRAKQDHERHAADKAVRDSLYTIIERIELNADREARAQERDHATGRRLEPWRCPAGCSLDASDCGRVQFRRHCMPSAADVASARRHLWEAANLTPLGGFRDNIGRRYSARMQDRLRDEEMEALRDETPAFAPTDSELAEVQNAFLVWWDGKCTPATWLRRLLHQNEYLDSITSREYRGESNEYMPSEDTLAACRYRRCYGCARCWISADRFGPDFRPVGPAACARRGCSGCCYCRGDKSLPVYLQVCTTYNYYHQEHNYYGRYQNGGPWLSIPALLRYLDGLLSAPRDSAVPVYLLCRQAEPVGDGRAICVAGAVRHHLPADKLRSCVNGLRTRRGIWLQILETDTRECIITDDEKANMNQHVSSLASLQFDAEEEWAPQRKEAGELSEQLEWERLTRHSCGERLHSRNSRSAFRVGDMVYSPPWKCRMQHGVAVITWMGGCTSAESGVRLPTGELELLMWDPESRRFAERTVRTDYGGCCNWMLMPPCCGRGAACPQLARARPEERHWPNGDNLLLNDIVPIPAALRAWAESIVPPRKLEAQLRPFKRLFACRRPPEPPPSPPPASTQLLQLPPPSTQLLQLCDEMGVKVVTEPAAPQSTSPPTAAQPDATPSPPQQLADTCEAIATQGAAPTESSSMEPLAPASSPASAPTPAVAPAPAAASIDTPCWWMDLPADIEAKVQADVDSYIERHGKGTPRADIEQHFRVLAASKAGYGPQTPFGWITAPRGGLSWDEYKRRVHETAEREWRARLAQGILRIERSWPERAPASEPAHTASQLRAESDNSPLPPPLAASSEPGISPPQLLAAPSQPVAVTVTSEPAVDTTHDDSESDGEVAICEDGPDPEDQPAVASSDLTRYLDGLKGKDGSITLEIAPGCMGKLVDVRGAWHKSIHEAAHEQSPLFRSIGVWEYGARVDIQQSADGSGVVTMTGSAYKLKRLHAAIEALLDSDSDGGQSSGGSESGSESGSDGEASGSDESQTPECDCGGLCSRCYEDHYV